MADVDGHLLLRLPSHLAATPLEQLRVTGKVQTYALAFSGCEGLTLRGLAFHATAVLLYNSEEATVDGCTFDYPSASRRSLGATEIEFDAYGAYGLAYYVAAQGLLARYMLRRASNNPVNSQIACSLSLSLSLLVALSLCDSRVRAPLLMMAAAPPTTRSKCRRSGLAARGRAACARAWRSRAT